MTLFSYSPSLPFSYSIHNPCPCPRPCTCPRPCPCPCAILRITTSACDPDELDPLHAAALGLGLGLEPGLVSPGEEGGEGGGYPFPLPGGSPLLAVADGSDNNNDDNDNNDNVGMMANGNNHNGNNNGNNSMKDNNNDSDSDSDSDSMLDDSLEYGQPQPLPQPPPQQLPQQSSPPPLPPFVLSEHFPSTDVQLMREVSFMPCLEDPPPASHLPTLVAPSLIISSHL